MTGRYVRIRRKLMLITVVVPTALFVSLSVRRPSLTHISHTSARPLNDGRSIAPPTPGYTTPPQQLGMLGDVGQWLHYITNESAKTTVIAFVLLRILTFRWVVVRAPFSVVASHFCPPRLCVCVCRCMCLSPCVRAPL